MSRRSLGFALASLLAVMSLVASLSYRCFASPSEIRVKKDVAYMYVLDIYGNLVSSHVEVEITADSAVPARNLTIVDLEEGIYPLSLEMVEGSEPTAIEPLDDGRLRIVWKDLQPKGGLVKLRYKAQVDTRPPISVRLDILGENVEVERDMYVVAGVEEGKELRISLRIVNNSTYYALLDSRRVPYPYLATVIFSYPRNMISVESSPEPNATASKDEDGVLYWSFYLGDEMRIDFSAKILSMGAWNSVWMPPVVIQLSDNPKDVIAFLEASRMEEIFNESVKSRNDMMMFKDFLGQMKENLTYVSAMMKDIGTLELEAAEGMGNISKALHRALELMESSGLTEEDIEKMLDEIRSSVDFSIDVLTRIEKFLQEELGEGNSSGYISYLVENIEDAKSRLFTMKETLGSLSARDIGRVRDKVVSLYRAIKGTQRMLAKSGKLHLALAKSLASEVEPAVEQGLEMLNSYLSSLEEKISRLNTTVLEMDAIEELARRREKDILGSIVVFANNTRKEAKIAYNVMHTYSVKVPLFTSEPAGLEAPPHKAESGSLSSIYPAVIVGVAALLAIAVAVALRKRGDRHAEEIEDMDTQLIGLLEEIEESFTSSKLSSQ